MRPCAAAFIAATVALAGAALAEEPRARPASAASAAVVAVYLPGAPLASIGTKAKLVSDLAATLERALGQPVSGRAYANLEDLEADADELSFALVDAAVVAAGRSPLRPMLVSVHAGRDRARFGIYAGPSVAGAYALEGKRVAFPRLGRVAGPFLEGFLLDGQLSLARLVRVPVPDASSALATIRLGKADAVALSAPAFAQLGGAGLGLRLLVSSEEAPLATFCTGGHALAPALVARARAAMLEFSAPAAGIEALRAPAADAFETLRRGLSARHTRVAPAHEPPASFRGPDFKAPPPAVPLPPLRAYLAPL
jgi:hypothetical protein